MAFRISLSIERVLSVLIIRVEYWTWSMMTSFLGRGILYLRDFNISPVQLVFSASIEILSDNSL